MATRDDSRDMANRIRAMLEVIQHTRPEEFDATQRREIGRLDDAIHEALLAIKAYVHLRNSM